MTHQLDERENRIEIEPANHSTWRVFHLGAPRNSTGAPVTRRWPEPFCQANRCGVFLLAVVAFAGRPTPFAQALAGIGVIIAWRVSRRTAGMQHALDEGVDARVDDDLIVEL